MPRKPQGPKTRQAKPLPDIYEAPPVKVRTDKRGVIEAHIMAVVVELADGFGAFDPNSRGFMVGRIQHFLRTTEDPPQVEYVLSEIVKMRAENFLAIRDFSQGTYEWMRLRLGYPNGAWKYAWWAENCGNKVRRHSAEVWLGVWADRLDEIDPLTQESDFTVQRAKVMLQKLYDADMLESIAW